MPIEEGWLVAHVGQAIQQLQKRCLAVDVGANRGTWTDELANIFESVIAVEPDPRAASSIAARDNVRVIVSAAANTSGEGVLYLREKPDQNSLLEVHPIGGESCVPVPHVGTAKVTLVSLDDLCPEGADFVKIDVEGAEALVLQGCSADGRWARTRFIVECHDTKESVEKELARLGKTPLWVAHPSFAHPGHCWAVS